MTLPGACGRSLDGASNRLAEDVLHLARSKASRADLRHLEFRRGDMTALDFADGSFDAVVCVFGIFFVPDMETQLARLRRLVRPGGQLAITTWGPELFAPAYEMWLSALRRVCPELHSAFKPWDRITTTDAVRQLFAEAGLPNVEVEGEEGCQLLQSAEDFWTIALGSGLRWTIDQMGPEKAAAVRRIVMEQLVAAGVDRVATNVIFAVARVDQS